MRVWPKGTLPASTGTAIDDEQQLLAAFSPLDILTQGNITVPHTPRCNQILPPFWMPQIHPCAANTFQEKIHTRMPPTPRQDRARNCQSLVVPGPLDRQVADTMGCLWHMLAHGVRHVPAHAAACDGTNPIATAAGAWMGRSPQQIPTGGPPVAGQSRSLPAHGASPWSVWFPQTEKDCRGHVQGYRGWRGATCRGVHWYSAFPSLNEALPKAPTQPGCSTGPDWSLRATGCSARSNNRPAAAGRGSAHRRGRRRPVPVRPRAVARRAAGKGLQSPTASPWHCSTAAPSWGSAQQACPPDRWASEGCLALAMAAVGKPGRHGAPGGAVRSPRTPGGRPVKPAAAMPVPRPLPDRAWEPLVFAACRCGHYAGAAPASASRSRPRALACAPPDCPSPAACAPCHASSLSCRPQNVQGPANGTATQRTSMLLWVEHAQAHGIASLTAIQRSSMLLWFKDAKGSMGVTSTSAAWRTWRRLRFVDFWAVDAAAAVPRGPQLLPGLGLAAFSFPCAAVVAAQQTLQLSPPCALPWHCQHQNPCNHLQSFLTQPLVLKQLTTTSTQQHGFPHQQWGLISPTWMPMISSVLACDCSYA